MISCTNGTTLFPEAQLCSARQGKSTDVLPFQQQQEPPASERNPLVGGKSPGSCPGGWQHPHPSEFPGLVPPPPETTSEPRNSQWATRRQ